MPTDFKERSRSYFDLHRTSRWAHNGYWSFDYARSIQVLKELQPASLIDIGCGPGGFLARVQRELPDVRLAAMDLSEGMVVEVRERFGGSVEAIAGDAEAMPLASDTYDAVTVNMSIHHWPHPQLAANEIYRILVPGGHLLLEDMDCIAPIRAVANVVFPRLPGGDVKMYTQEEIRSMLVSAGFEVQSYRKITPYTFLCVAQKPPVDSAPSEERAVTPEAEHANYEKSPNQELATLAYTSKYFNVIAPIVRHLLQRRYGYDLAKRAYDGARPIYRQMIADCPPVGSDNPMAKNLYESCVFFALYRAAEGRITPDMMREVVEDLFSLPPMRLMGLVQDLNRPADMAALNRTLRADAQWVVDHPETEPYTWDFNFGDTKGETRVCYHFTHCPINDFCREQGLMDILPVMCDVDHITPRLIHGRLTRQYTLATGGPICDYLITGDKVAAE